MPWQYNQIMTPQRLLFTLVAEAAVTPTRTAGRNMCVTLSSGQQLYCG